MIMVNINTEICRKSRENVKKMSRISLGNVPDEPGGCVSKCLLYFSIQTLSGMNFILFWFVLIYYDHILFNVLNLLFHILATIIAPTNHAIKFKEYTLQSEKNIFKYVQDNKISEYSSELISNDQH